MTSQQLFAAISAADDELLERSESAVLFKKSPPIISRLMPVCACFAIFALAAAGILFSTPDSYPTNNYIYSSDSAETQHSVSLESSTVLADAANGSCDVETETMYSPGGEQSQLCTPLLVFNEADSIISASDRAYVRLFAGKLTDSELAVILPKDADSFDISGYATFHYYDNSLYQLRLTVSPDASDTAGSTDSNTNNGTVSVCVSRKQPFSCCVLPDDPVTTTLSGIEITASEYTYGSSVSLYVDFVMDGVYYTICAETTPEKKSNVKSTLAELTSIFILDGAMDLSTITPRSVPEMKNETLSLPEALADPDFGSYMLSEIPGGFALESIRRYMDQTSDYLSGLWTCGYDSLSWKVYRTDEDALGRVTAVDDMENYDLSLYPIPRAESVPDGLREIVDNPIFKADELTMDAVMARAYTVRDAGDTSGYRMRFSVLYGDIIVEVSAKGVSPQWVYGQLMAISCPVTH